MTLNSTSFGELRPLWCSTFFAIGLWYTRASNAEHWQLLCGLLFVHVGEKGNGLWLVSNQALGGCWLSLDANNWIPADVSSDEVSNLGFSSACLFLWDLLICGPDILPLQLFELAVFFLMKWSLVACWKPLHLKKECAFTQEMKVPTSIFSTMYSV